MNITMMSLINLMNLSNLLKYRIFIKINNMTFFIIQNISWVTIEYTWLIHLLKLFSVSQLIFFSFNAFLGVHDDFSADVVFKFFFVLDHEVFDGFVGVGEDVRVYLLQINKLLFIHPILWLLIIIILNWIHIFAKIVNSKDIFLIYFIFFKLNTLALILKEVVL